MRKRLRSRCRDPPSAHGDVSIRICLTKGAAFLGANHESGAHTQSSSVQRLCSQAQAMANGRTHSKQADGGWLRVGCE